MVAAAWDILSYIGWCWWCVWSGDTVLQLLLLLLLLLLPPMVPPPALLLPALPLLLLDRIMSG
jgi:hypothetical protein